MIKIDWKFEIFGRFTIKHQGSTFSFFLIELAAVTFRTNGVIAIIDARWAIVISSLTHLNRFQATGEPMHRLRW